MDTRTILLDVGGSYIKRQSGDQIPIPSDGSRNAIADALRKAVEIPGTSPRMTTGGSRMTTGGSTMTTRGLARIGIAIPGPFDYRTGMFLMKHKFAAVYGEMFTELAGIPEGVTVKYIHDVNAVLEGALRMMDLRDGNTALVTLGTGLGFSIAVKGQVRYGPTGSPADSIWNLPWKDSILEDYVGSKGVRKFWMAEGGDANDSAAVIAKKAGEGNPAAISAYEKVGDTLGEALKGLMEEHKIDTLLFAGQVSKSLDLMEPSIRKHLKDIKIALAPAGAVFKGIASLFENN